MGMLEELRIDKVVEENKKLERDLNKIMKNLHKNKGSDEASEERFVDDAFHFVLVYTEKRS